MLRHEQRYSIIRESVREILPIYDSEAVKKRTITLTNYVRDERFYVDITNIYGLYLLRFHYGVGSYLSELFIYMHGMHLRTNYYFFRYLFNIKYIVLCYAAINKIACEFNYSNLKKKFLQNTYWSVSYIHKFPCRGQRRRSNASTPKRLNISAQFVNAVNSSNSAVLSNKARYRDRDAPR